jgi:hypothetical protein
MTFMSLLFSLRIVFPIAACGLPKKATAIFLEIAMLAGVASAVSVVPASKG